VSHTRRSHSGTSACTDAGGLKSMCLQAKQAMIVIVAPSSAEGWDSKSRPMQPPHASQNLSLASLYAHNKAGLNTRRHRFPSGLTRSILLHRAHDA